MGLTITPVGSGGSAQMATISYTQNALLQNIGGPIFTKNATITGTAGVGSSLFLNRMAIPANMNISEVDIAMKLQFNATNNGNGTMSRNFAIYSFGNGTSLNLMSSFSSSSAWNTGTSTAGASSSLTQFQGGWTANFIQPMTFTPMSLPPGDYVIAQLMDFSQANFSWAFSLYGGQAFTNTLVLNGATLATSTDAAMGSGGLLAASAFSATTSKALTAWSAAASAMEFRGIGSTAAFSTTNVSTFTAGSLVIKATATAASTLSLLLNTGTQAMGLMSSAGLIVGSFFTSSASIAPITSASIGVGFANVAQIVTPSFGYVGTGSTTSGAPGPFFCGIMSTGAIPASIAITSSAVKSSGSTALIQPWFSLVGV